MQVRTQEGRGGGGGWGLDPLLDHDYAFFKNWAQIWSPWPPCLRVDLSWTPYVYLNDLQNHAWI